MANSISYKLLLSTSFDDTRRLVVDALKQEGFGILTEIDVQATLKEKLGEDFRRYTILGTCNPPFAHKALTSEPAVGVMLPCNVTLDEREDGVLVSFVNPEMMMAVGELGSNALLCDVAGEVNKRIVSAVERLKAQSLA
jgi:uncharacterized protein (DUF302 family)